MSDGTILGPDGRPLSGHAGDEREDDEAADQGAGSRPMTDQERAEAYKEEVKRLHVIDLVRAMLVDLVTLGYQKLGLTAETEELRDLGDARVAIEALRRLIEVVEMDADAHEVATYRSTLAAMQIQYARAAEAKPGARVEARPERDQDAERDVPAPAAADAAATEGAGAAEAAPAAKVGSTRPPAGGRKAKRPASAKGKGALPKTARRPRSKRSD